MTEPARKPIGLAALDAMIARAEGAYERGKVALETYPTYRQTQLAMLRARQQAMAAALARLQAKRVDMGG